MNIDWLINHYQDAIDATKQTAVNPITVLAMGALESGFGKSGLARLHGNYFGIKGTSPYGSINLPTLEYRNGQYVRVQQPFRVYPGFKESAADFVRLINTNTRYVGALQTFDPLSQITAIWRAGYATDPNYVSKLKPIVDQANALNVTTNQAMHPLTLLIIAAGTYFIVKPKKIWA